MVRNFFFTTMQNVIRKNNDFVYFYFVITVHMTALWAKPKNAFSITDYHVDLHVTSLTSVNILGQIQDNEVPLPIARIPVNKFTSIVEAISEKNEIGEFCQLICIFIFDNL